LDDNDIKELEKPLTNDVQVVDVLNIIDVYQCSSVHLYVEHRIDEPEVVWEVTLLSSPGPHPDEPNDDDENNGHGNDTKNAEGNVGHGDEIPIAENIEGDEAAAANGAQKNATAPKKKKKKKKAKHKGVRKKMDDVKSNADGTATVRRRKMGATSEVPRPDTQSP
jgi:hypothetical protein